jgi:hypothetical protein
LKKENEKREDKGKGTRSNLYKFES